MSSSGSSKARDSIRGLAATQSALARRLDALRDEIERLPAERGASDAARLLKLQEAVADLAGAHHDVHRQLDVLVDAVERLASDQLGPDAGGPTATDQPRPAAFVPPVARRGRLARLKSLARIVLRSTLGKLRHVWDATHPRPPWGDEIRLTVTDKPTKLPSLTVVIHGDSHTAAEIEARLARQTDGDVARRIQDPDGDSRQVTIDTDYVWDVGPETRDLPPAFVESARLLLATEALGFVCYETPGGSCQWIVARELRHATGGLDLGAASRLAKRQPGRVLGKIHSSTAELLPEALCRPKIRRRVRRSGPYVLAVATRPRTVRHRLSPVPTATRARPDADPRRPPAILLLLTADLAGGLEKAVAARLETLAKDNRLVLATTTTQTDWIARWRALERFTPHAYDLGILARELHTGLIEELIARHDVRRLVQAGDGEVWPRLASALRRRLPDLDVAEAELRVVVGSPGDQEAPPIPSGNGVSTSREPRWPASSLVVAMRADLIASQRPEDFVALAHRFRDDRRYRFLLAGDGPLSATVRDLRRLLGLHNLRIERPERSLEALFDLADIVCTTAESDPFPHTVLAALHRRRPVIGAAPELGPLLEIGPCGIAVPHPGDLDGFVSAVESLADDDLRHELGEHGPRAISLQGAPAADEDP